MEVHKIRDGEASAGCGPGGHTSFQRVDTAVFCEQLPQILLSCVTAFIDAQVCHSKCCMVTVCLQKYLLVQLVVCSALRDRELTWAEVGFGTSNCCWIISLGYVWPHRGGVRLA